MVEKHKMKLEVDAECESAVEELNEVRKAAEDAQAAVVRLDAALNSLQGGGGMGAEEARIELRRMQDGQ